LLFFRIYRRFRVFVRRFTDAMMMAALGRLVTWFDDNTPLELITELQPDILVKAVTTWTHAG
jgi:bifunctional ADP-heptose synthase (sugar kinase/adenylyltransferase)